jgi:hypothetical protein
VQTLLYLNYYRVSSNRVTAKFLSGRSRFFGPAARRSYYLDYQSFISNSALSMWRTLVESPVSSKSRIACAALYMHSISRTSITQRSACSVDTARGGNPLFRLLADTSKSSNRLVRGHDLPCCIGCACGWDGVVGPDLLEEV